ncbi:hypothetical protein XENOCAPTIV_019568, partial [Xenoophorus captivus]
LDNFKTQSVRSAVNVREGQGVVLLCGAPPHSGGKSCHIKLLFAYSCAIFILPIGLVSIYFATFDKTIFDYMYN